MEEKNLNKEFELRLKDIEVRRAVVLANQEKELKPWKRQEFFTSMRSDVSPESTCSVFVKNLSDIAAE